MSGSGSMTVSLNGTVAANLLVLLVAWEDDSNNQAYPADVVDGVNTWNNHAGGGDSLGYYHMNSMGIYSAYNIAGGNVTVTISVYSGSSAFSVYGRAVLVEVAGAKTSAALDSNGVENTGASSTGPLTVTTGTLGTVGDIVFGGFNVLSNTDTGLTTPATWNSLGLSLTDYPSYGFSYKITTANTALSPSYGSLGTSAAWGLATAAYEPASAALNFTLTAGAGSFVETGENAVFSLSSSSTHLLLANPGAFDLVGAESQSQLELYTTFGSIVMTGENAILNSSSGQAYSLACAYGSFSMTGINAVLQTLSYVFPVPFGSFVWTGEQATLISPGNPTGYEFLPNFVGMDWLEASLVLYQGGYAEINPVIVRMKGLTQASQKGIVMGQAPLANTLVKPGTAVQLSVNSDSLLSVAFEA